MRIVREKVRESIMGSAEAVRCSNRCLHVWIGWRALLFGYMPVDWWCVRCGTWAMEVQA